MTYTLHPSGLVECGGRTFIPDPNNGDYAGYLAWVAAGNTPATPAPVPLTKDDYAAAVQAHINKAAADQGYFDEPTCASYVNSANAEWSADGTAFVLWRDEVWESALAELAAVEAGQRAAPTVAALVSELPVIVWS